MIDHHEWERLRKLFRRAFMTNLHVSIASVGLLGEPLVTPIGSLLLGEPGHALYFELFARGLGARLAVDPRVSVLAVDSGRWLWLSGLTRARLARPPAVRLVGRAASQCRPSTEAERVRWQRRIALVARLPGSRLLWSHLDTVRDLSIERVDWMKLGPLTSMERSLK